MSISLIIFSVSFFALTGPFMELRRVFVCTLPKPTIFWVGDFAAFRAGVLLPLFCSFGTYIRRRREGSKWHSIIMSVNDERAMRMRIQFAMNYWLCDSVRGEFWLREGDGGSRALKYLLHLELAFILRRLFKVAGLHPMGRMLSR
jgi:hypothetical protein